MQPQGPYQNGRPTSGNRQQYYGPPPPGYHPYQPTPSPTPRPMYAASLPEGPRAMPSDPTAPMFPGQQVPNGPMQIVGPSQPSLRGQPPTANGFPRPNQPQHPGNGLNPNDNLPPPPEAPETPYDFFMQPKPTQPLNPLPVTGRHLGNLPVDMNTKEKFSLKSKFPLIAGGGIAVILIFGIASALIPKDKTGAQLFGIAQSQQEIVRLCTLGSQKSVYRTTKNFAITCSTSVYTNQQQLLSYMQKQNITFNAKQIAAKASAATDAKLAAAVSSSSYDDTFRSVVQEQLTSYNQSLTSQLGITTGANARELLSKSQSGTELLIQMAKDDSDKTVAAPDSGE